MSKTTSHGIIAIAASCLALLAGPANAKDAPTLTIEHFIGTIDMRTGDYDKITVTDADGAPVTRTQGGVTINGGETLKNTNCKKSSASVKISVGNWRWNKRKGSYKNLNEYPSLKITAPKNTHLVIDKAVIFGNVGNIGSADIRLQSCGDFDLADISGRIDLRIAGSGDISMGNAGIGDIRIAGSGNFTALDMEQVKTSIAGSGDVHIGNVSGSVEARIAGSGDAEFDNVGGDFNYRGAGSGNLDVGDIDGNADITTAGSGNVEIGRIEGDLSYSSGGSGDFGADYVGGTELSAKTGGSGTIEIDGGNVTGLYLKAGGSGNVRYDGKSTNAELYVNGSAEISIREPSGKLHKEKRGSGSIRIR